MLRIRGDLGPAEVAYAEAARHGFEPQPGLALLWLAQGRTAAAVAAARSGWWPSRDPRSCCRRCCPE